MLILIEKVCRSSPFQAEGTPVAVTHNALLCPGGQLVPICLLNLLWVSSLKKSQQLYVKDYSGKTGPGSFCNTCSLRKARLAGQQEPKGIRFKYMTNSN